MGWKKKLLDIFTPDLSGGACAETDYVKPNSLDNPVIKYLESEMEGRYMLKIESTDSVGYHMAMGILNQPDND